MPCSTSSCRRCARSGLLQANRGVRHWIDGSGRRARVRGAAGHGKRITDDGLHHPAIGCRCQPIADAEIYAENTELEVGYHEQCVLLLEQRLEVAYLAEVRIVFESSIEIGTELARDPRSRREVGFAILAEADIDDRIDDELVGAVA